MLNTLTLKKAHQAIKSKDISINELITKCTEVSQSKNNDINAYTYIKEDANFQEQSNTKISGIPLAIKDNFCTKDMPTTASSKVLESFIPPFDSSVTQKLRSSGAVLIGKTNMDAWAHGSSTETSDFGVTKNPRNTDYLPGGSSGGSAAAVAADMCIAALGTETAGSIRQPASWCGIVGLKPTYGRVSRYGIVAMASSTDSPGPMTKTVEDSAILLNAIAGHDPLDATTSPQATPDFTASLQKPIKDMRIGYIYHNLAEFEETKSRFEEQLKVLEHLGATVEQAPTFDPHYAIGVYTIVQRGEVSSNLARYTGIRYGGDRSHFGDEAKRRIMLGTYTLSKGYAEQYYTHANKVRTLFMRDFQELFERYDALVSLSSPGFAKKRGASEGQAMFGELEDMLLEPSSICGLPGVSVPCYRDETTNLFLGMNITTPWWKEGRAIQIADAFERATRWNTWRNKQ